MATLMATGYVHAMLDQRQSFEQFTLACARAFGALITMRDDPSDAPIPDEIKPDDHYANRVKETCAEAARLAAMTPEEQRAFGEAKRQEEIEYHGKQLAAERDEVDRVRAMLAQAKAWTPPTAEHQKLHAFMIEQLTNSLPREGSNYHANAMARARAKSADDYYAEALASANSSIASAIERRDEEEKRCADRTAWIRALKASLTAK